MVNASDSGYNQVTDQASNLTVAATLLARSLYTLATGSPAPEGLMAEQQSVRGKKFCWMKINDEITYSIHFISIYIAHLIHTT